MLFPRAYTNGGTATPRPSRFTPRPRRTVVVLQPVEVLPEHYRQLPIVCKKTSHPLPCSTVFSRFETSEKGRRIAVYRCPLCGFTYAYCRDDTTGRPRLLFVHPA